jgi:diketogulonate reductase-like aldo/keto reductase
MRVNGAMRYTKLPSGESIPMLGQGTWQLGERPERRSEELAALQLGIDLGMTLIDTAEMYGDGTAEQLVADAIADRRDQVFVVSKVLPSNATRKQRLITACERSLRRLRVECIDLYLLHWRQKENLVEVVDAFQELVAAGKIRYWGVSNFDLADMAELQRVPGGESVAVNQVLYNLSRRGIEYDMLPKCRTSGLTVMAYTPIEQGRILGNKVLQKVATRHDASPAQVALAWVLRQDGVVAIPRTGSTAHLRENHGALNVTLSPHDLEELDRAFPPPQRPQPLEML